MGGSLSRKTLGLFRMIIGSLIIDSQCSHRVSFMLLSTACVASVLTGSLVLVVLDLDLAYEWNYFGFAPLPGFRMKH